MTKKAASPARKSRAAEVIPVSRYSLSELERAAFRELDAVRRVIWSAQWVLDAGPRDAGRAANKKARRRGKGALVNPTPAHQLLANYLALFEFVGFPEWSGPALEWLDRIITAGRLSTIRLSRGPSPSAFHAVWMLPDAALPVPDDPFRIRSLFEALWHAYASDPVLQCSPDDTRSIHRSASVLQADYHELSFALVCGFSGISAPPFASLSPVHRKLASAIAADRSFRGALKRVRVRALANFLCELATDEDLTIIRQEMRWEFARVAERVTGPIPPLPVIARTPKKRRGARAGKERRADPRGEFAYKLLSKDLPLKKARAQFNDEASRRDWDGVESDNGIKYLASQYARVQGLPPIPPRKAQ